MPKSIDYSPDLNFKKGHLSLPNKDIRVRTNHIIFLIGRSIMQNEEAILLAHVSETCH